MAAIAEIMAKIGAVESMIAIVSQTPEGPMKTMQMEMVTQHHRSEYINADNLLLIII